MHRKELGRIGVALGSGSARGWAHIGVLRGLEERGLVPDIVCGTSQGAIVGAAYAAGKLGQLEAWVRTLDQRKVRSLLDLSGRGGLIKAERVLAEMTAHLDNPTIDSLQKDFIAVATDMHTGREVWLREGNLAECLRASAAIPGIVTPVRINERWLVDGALVNPVPVAPCRALGADTVIAVDLNTTLLNTRNFVEASSASEPPPDPSDPSLDEPQEDKGGQIAWTEYLSQTTAEWRERFFGDSEDDEEKPPTIYEVAAQGAHIMQVRITRSRMAGDPPDLLVSPQLPDFSLLEFHRAAEAIDEGRRALDRALVAAPLV